MRNILKINSISLLILSNFALLLFILNIPGTIALRNILAGSLIIILVTVWIKKNLPIKDLLEYKDFMRIVLILLVLSVYILLHSIFIADEMKWSLSQYRTQWVYPMLYFMMGIFLAFFASTGKYFNKTTLINILFFSLFIHVLFVDFIGIYQYIEKGRLWRVGGLTGSPVLANYVTNILISIIIVELLYRFRIKNKMIQLNIFWLIVTLFLCILSSALEGLRFGAISLFFMSLTGLTLIIIDNNKFNIKAKYFIALTLVILCSLPLLYNAKNDVRWTSLIETIPIAIDTETHLYWQGANNDIPKLKNGNNVNGSNYMRIAWASKGVEYISNDLYGIGYGRNVFGHAIEKYEKTSEAIRGYHSHSSIIDLTIGIGLLGLAVWLFFIFKIIILTARIFLNTGNYFALLSVFITSGFFIRSFFDSNMRDHMFKQFFLLLGIALTLALYEFHKDKKI